MFRCHHCKHVAYTRTSREMSDRTKERYYQCTNVNCSATFATLETVEKDITTPNLQNYAEPHPGKDNQLGIAFDMAESDG